MEKIAFILGAGAHEPFGFPIGDALIRGVAEQMSNEAIEHPHIAEPTHKFRKALLGCGVSIDRFLHEYRNVNGLGEFVKKLIAKHLLQKEAAAKDTNIGDWLRYLWKYLNKVPKALPNTFVFITFNYDRTLEYQLANACSDLWNMGFRSAAELVAKSLPLYHVYGSFGSLAYGQSDHVAYGHVDEAKIAGSRIRVIGEHDDSLATKVTQEIHEKLAEVGHVFMLGCAYHEENMTLLALDRLKVPVYGSCYDFTDAEKHTVMRHFPYLNLYDVNPVWKADKFIREFHALQERL